MARTVKQLSAREVETKRKPGKYHDGAGLYLQVTPAGGRSWIFRYMLRGKAREMGLGPAPAVPLATQIVVAEDGTKREIRGARDLAADCRRLLAAGVDPIEERKRLAAQALAADARSKLFSECAADYIKAHKAGWGNEKHAAQWTATIDTYTAHVLGGMPVSKIDAGDVLRALEPIWTTKPETASRLRGRIERILDWAAVRGYRERGINPAAWKGNLEHQLPKRSKVAKVRHHPALAYERMGEFMKALRAQDGIGARALEFIILTAARTGEVVGATWDEIDLGAKVWNVPADRMKAKRPHKVPLSPAAVQLVEAMKKFRDGDYVFPGQSAGDPLSNMACLMTLERMHEARAWKDAHGQKITVHGFRSAFRDWAAERTGFAREVVEMALAHAIGDKVEAAYRRGDLFEKRRRLMDAWAEHCAKVQSATVTPIRAAKHA